ncbi:MULTISPECIES: rhodanese-like domain-containing protein [Thiorhodovibrio]|uniref:rhodanese-like domain-containing protein n=1 Tax=Thiorhodovibrio TaxID=61593 RepID=UPI001913598F|nr:MULTISPECIES: rhodanese-like domain-containing protein [Thiorhodovibrio]MBK5968830.1 sulfurtransferase [Thiorhodovibrio winogradskyi]WPL12600.1 Rhodanese-like domain protein [Thiorhodovibrio litoralis]
MKTRFIAPLTRAHLGVLTAGLLLPLALMAADNRITPDIETVQVMHNGEMVTIKRGHDRDATLPEVFQKTDRGCPPFCVQPMEVVPGVETIGEIDLLGYLQRMTEGDDNIMVIDSRTPDWVMRGTIPGSINIPWNKINNEGSGIFETPTEADTFVHILADQFGATQDPASKAWSFDDAKTLVFFCNGIWCPQSSINIKTLHAIGYPVHKMKWYRGGMQDWVSVGLTTVEPE